MFGGGGVPDSAKPSLLMLMHVSLKKIDSNYSIINHG